MKYADLNESLKAHIATLRMGMALLVIINFSLWYGWNGAKNDIRIHIPPDIRSGAVLRAGEIRPANIYTFTSYIFQQLYHWAENGEEDYGMQIFNMSPYLTPRFREYLINDLDVRGKKGELSGRTRSIQPLAGQGYEERRVDIIDKNSWIVWVDFRIKESVRGMDIKNVLIRYPVKVVRYEIDPETNPWGLALNGFGSEGPKRLSEADIAASSKEKNTTPPGD
ncbi:MAG: PFL_4703 family integrating conjugative element protein [Methylococcaceae bacterium]